jgi:hypothetical protein
MGEMSGEKRRSQLVRVGKSWRCCCCVVWVGPEQVFWHAAKNPKEILRPQTPLSSTSQKKTVQSDVTAETALKSALKKCSEFLNKATLLAVRGLEELFFQLCCCVSFLVSGRK